MFYYVEGKAAHIEPNVVVIDCGGVGYACHTSQNTCAALRLGEPAKLYTHLYVREEIFDLYGFAEQEELNCFLGKTVPILPSAGDFVVCTAVPACAVYHHGG